MFKFLAFFIATVAISSSYAGIRAVCTDLRFGSIEGLQLIKTTQSAVYNVLLQNDDGTESMAFDFYGPVLITEDEIMSYGASKYIGSVNDYSITLQFSGSVEGIQAVISDGCSTFSPGMFCMSVDTP